jgi:hypothetical protein
MTTRHTLEVFAERNNTHWEFRPGISAWVDFQGENHVQTAAACRVLSIMGVHQHYNLALLEVEPPPDTPAGPIAPLALSFDPPEPLAGRPVYMVGYPIRDSRRSEPERIARTFRDCYNAKAVQPGQLRGQFPFREIELLEHDCAMLGRSRGSCLVDLEEHQVLGLHISGRYLERSTAIPLWVLHDDPFLRDAGVTFAHPRCQQELDHATEQLRSLFQTPLWQEASRAIDQLHRRAFSGQ